MKTEIFIGIVPGATGAVAILDNGHQTDCRAVIEKVNAMPKQGVSSTFKFGVNFGQWIGRLEALGIPFDFVTPAKWRKRVFDSMPKGDTKVMSLDRARRLFPQITNRLMRKKDHGRAEALLLAEYARRSAA